MGATADPTSEVDENSRDRRRGEREEKVKSLSGRTMRSDALTERRSHGIEMREGTNSSVPRKHMMYVEFHQHAKLYLERGGRESSNL